MRMDALLEMDEEMDALQARAYFQGRMIEQAAVMLRLKMAVLAARRGGNVSDLRRARYAWDEGLQNLTMLCNIVAGINDEIRVLGLE